MSKTKKASAPAEAQALAVQDAPGAILTAHEAGMQPRGIVEQLIDLARDPAVDIVKINALIDANERLMKIQAKVAFDQAFAAMQGELPIISAEGRIIISGDDVRLFATAANIQRACKPAMTKHGFGLRFRHEVTDGLLTVIGILTHAQGHSEQDAFVTGRDDSGKKNVIQSWGSARQYGQRYTTRALLNITSEAAEDMDDDGEATGPRQESPAPRERSYAVDPNDTRPISDRNQNQPANDKKVRGQRGKFYATVKGAGRKDDEIREYLKQRYGFASSKAITRNVFQQILDEVSRNEPLPLEPYVMGQRSEREPGDDDV